MIDRRDAPIEELTDSELHLIASGRLAERPKVRDAILRPILEELWEMPYRDIAQELTNRNIPTPRGGDLWNAMTVVRVMKRLGIVGQ